MKTPRLAAAVLLSIALAALSASASCPAGQHEEGGMAAMGGMAAVPGRCVNDAPAQSDKHASANFQSLSAGANVAEPVVQPVENGAPSETGNPPNAASNAANQAADGDNAAALERQRKQMLEDDKCADEKGHVNRFFDALKSQNAKPLDDKQYNDFKAYMYAEDRLKDVIMKQLPRQAGPEVKKILDEGDYTQAGVLDEKLHAVFDRWGGNWAKFAPERGFWHPWGGDWGEARGDAFKKMEAVMQPPLATPLMQSDAVATWLMSKGGGSKEEEQQHDQGWKDNAGKDPFPFLYSGNKELQNGETNAAISDLSKAISLDPSNAQALALRGEAYAMKGDYPSAGADAKAALALNPGDEKMQRLYAISQDKGAYGASAAARDLSGLGGSGSGATVGSVGMEQARGGAGGASAAAVRDATAAMRLGDFRMAAGRLTQAIAMNGDNAAAYNLRSIAYNRLGQNELALKDAMAGLKIAPNNVALLITKAMALNKLHRYAEAEAAAREALRLDPNNARAYDALAQALAGQHKNSEVIAALRKAAALDPKFQAKLEQALQMPADSDLAFLFPDDDSLSAAKKTAAAPGVRGRKFGKVVGGTLIGGLLLGLILLKVFAPQLKEAFTKLTRRAPVVAASEPAYAAPALTPQADKARLLKGQYRFVKEIGAGGMGVVYEGDDTTLRRKVAIKKMRDEVRLDRRERERFVSEAKTVAGLHHPAIVDIYAIVEEGDDIYLVFEYVPGKTLYDLVHGDGNFNFAKAVGIIKEAGAAIDFAHSKNVIHRDLKPSNIMLNDEGRIKVMDFGIARLAKDAMAHFSQTNTVVGTPPYMAPEQEQGVVRRESDVYALSICLYELLTGRMPFNGSGAGMLMNKINKTYAAPSTLAPGLPAGVDEVFAKAFEPDPEKRFHSAKEFVAAVSALLPAKV